MVSFTSLAVLFSAVSVLALPAPIPEEASTLPVEIRQSGGATCGSTYYSSSNINAAQNAGCNYRSQGKTVGSGSYPHRYNNYEGFSFSTSSPWYEFPILASRKVFDGSTSPGPDRVIFNGACQLTALITHTGASGNAFVECSY